MSNMKPCAQPNICGVQNHRAGTACRGATAGGSSASGLHEPKPAAVQPWQRAEQDVKNRIQEHLDLMWSDSGSEFSIRWKQQEIGSGSYSPPDSEYNIDWTEMNKHVDPDLDLDDEEYEEELLSDRVDKILSEKGSAQIQKAASENVNAVALDPKNYSLFAKLQSPISPSNWDRAYARFEKLAEKNGVDADELYDEIDKNYALYASNAGGSKGATKG